MSTTTPTPNKAAILAALDALFDPSDTIELRAIPRGFLRATGKPTTAPVALPTTPYTGAMSNENIE